jgi:hypothetical protein
MCLSEQHSRQAEEGQDNSWTPKKLTISTNKNFHALFLLAPMFFTPKIFAIILLLYYLYDYTTLFSKIGPLF